MQFIGFEPAPKMLHVERLQEQAVTDGGVVKPDIAQQKTEICKVLAVGSGVQMSLTDGDYVQVRRYSGSDVFILGKETVVIHEEEIMGKYVVVPDQELAEVCH